MKRRVVNVMELSDGELVYIMLDDGKKYLLNGDRCWRCGSTAKCFRNMQEVIMNWKWFVSLTF